MFREKFFNGWACLFECNSLCIRTVSEFNEFKPRLKSAKNRFKLSAAGLNLEKLNTILSGTNHI